MDSLGVAFQRGKSQMSRLENASTMAGRLLSALLVFVFLSSCSATHRTNNTLTSAEWRRLQILEQNQRFAVLNIESPADKVLLETPSRPVDPDSPGIGRLIRHLEKTARHLGGAGIAAVQIGIPVKLVLLRRRDSDGEHFQAFLNPRIVQSSINTIASWEHCLSVPWGYRFTSRPVQITVDFQNTVGQSLDATLLGDEAVVFQQEADHLNGLLLSSDHTREWFVPSEEMSRFARGIWRQCQNLTQQQCDSLMEKGWRARAESHGHIPSSK